MINPELWPEFFKPRYMRVFEAIHTAGWHVWMHSDGKINAILATNGAAVEISEAAFGG